MRVLPGSCSVSYVSTMALAVLCFPTVYVCPTSRRVLLQTRAQPSTVHCCSTADTTRCHVHRQCTSVSATHSCCTAALMDRTNTNSITQRTTTCALVSTCPLRFSTLHTAPTTSLLHSCVPCLIARFCNLHTPQYVAAETWGGCVGLISTSTLNLGSRLIGTVTFSIVTCGFVRFSPTSHPSYRALLPIETLLSVGITAEIAVQNPLSLGVGSRIAKVR